MPAEATTLVLVHGFTQNAGCWGGVDRALGRGREVRALDAPGHGAASDVDAGPWEAADLLARDGGVGDYLGYSMGGRLALHVALAHPGLVRRLVLASATAGIEDERERAARRDADEALARGLEEDGDVAAFVERWLSGPLFEGVPPERACVEARLRNTAAGLASSLRRCGAGSQENLWPRLGELAMPVLVVAGGRDARFSAIGERMAGAVRRGRLAIIPDAGHACHLEQPGEFVRVVDDFLA